MPEIHDRGMVKWQPFDSLLSSKKVAREIIQEKNKVAMPTLSEDQLLNIEEKVLEAYYNGETVRLVYYRNGSYYTKISLIKYIDKYKKQLYLNDRSVLYFKQIVKIEQI